MLTHFDLSNIYDEGEGEVVVHLLHGYTVRSSSEEHLSGDYVRLCDPDGHELVYWDWTEWRDEPQLVMGAFIAVIAAASLGNAHTPYEPEEDL